jgi:ferrous iron transport protein B
MFLTFFATFELGKYPVEWIEGAVASFSVLISNLVPGGPLKDLLVDGIIGGVGSVIVFLPNILILFLFISFMEDTGYMARAAFIMDRVMHKIGLHGRSFIPLIMGFGCNVPAIMATRTIPDHKNRIVTVLINPFMSCSARLPVYILLIGAFFPKSPGLMLFLIYMIGILMAAIIGLLFKKTLFRSHEAPFVLELPPYRMPTVRSTIKHMWFKVYQYLKKMGGVILVASILIWALGYFPRNIELSKDYTGLISELSDNSTNENISNSGSEQTDNIDKIRLLQLEMEAEMQENSYIGRIGKFIEPAIKPLGFDWKMGVSLLTGVAAKEVVISTMGVLYQSDGGTRSSDLLVQKLRTETHPNGDLVFTPLVAFAFMMFILIYFPCVAVVAAVKKETGSWKWAAFLVIYTTGIAWLFAFLIYHLGSILG